MNDEIIRLDAAISHILPNPPQIVVDIFYHSFGGLSGKDLIQDKSMKGLGLQSKSQQFETYCDTCFDKAEYSRRFISRPLTSMLVFVPCPSSTLIAAYFFFWSSNRRWKTLSRSISKRLYCSFTAFLNIAEIFNALSKSLTFELTKRESVSP